MYEKYYKLKGKPFALSPDPKFFFKSKGHQRAMSYLRYGIQQGEGFIIVTGDVGTGKSMLVSTLFKDLDKHNLVAAKIVTTNVREADLLRMVAASFELKFDKASKAMLLHRMEDFFKACVDDGKRVLLLVDECQNLPNKSIEELRMLSNFEYQGRPLLQSFLLGQREFRTTMRSTGFEQLRQRVIAAYHLKPLNEEETKQYIQHRLKTVGWNNDPAIENDVFEGVFRFTAGVPRRINTLCDRLLLNACLEETHTITMHELGMVTGEIEDEHGMPDEVQEYQSDRELELETEEPRSSSTRKQAAPASNEKSNQEMHRLEAHLASMQSTVESLTRAVERSVTAKQYPSQIMPQKTEKPAGLPVWTIAFSGLALLVLIVGILAVYLFAR